jgi:hypothetical protein
VVVERVPRCEFERILFKVPAPEKTLRAVDSDQGEVSHFFVGLKGTGN